MGIPLLILAVSLMFSGVHSQYSFSSSCSTVNGKTICTDNQGNGNAAAASSSAVAGPGGTYQDSASGIGAGGQFSTNQETVVGGNPPAGAFPGYAYAGGFAGPFGAGGFPGFPFGRR